MTDYYVRKTGLDSNDGLTKGAAFLTIDKAANTVAAADTVYVGAGVYRELVTIDTSGTSGSIITWTADVDGTNTDDPGLVIISAYANELSAATRAACLDLNDGKQWNTFVGFVMAGGTTAVVNDGTAALNNYEGVVFEDCVLVAGHDDGDVCLQLDFNALVTAPSTGLRLRRCLFQGAGLRFQWSDNATADTDVDIVIESCVFMGIPGTSTNGAGFYWDKGGGADTFQVGGVLITNCLFTNKYYGVYVSDGSDTTNVIDVRNCMFVYLFRALFKSTTSDGALTSNYNTFAACQTPLTNVTTGGNDRDTTTDPGLWGGLGDYPLLRFLGWSPFRSWEPIRVEDGIDDYVHAAIGDANTADAPAFDLYNENRPMHGIVDDRGAVEGRARPEQETTTVRTGSNALRFEGAGFHDFIIPVSNQSTTVSIYGRFDSNYTGSKPILEVLNIDGVADQSDIMTGAANAWEQVTATFTPTADGVCRVRIRSQDTSATGEAFFDDLTVT